MTVKDAHQSAGGICALESLTPARRHTKEAVARMLS